MIKMSREEAIGRIQDHIRIHSKKEPFTPYLDKAFDMAIEALNRPHGEWIPCSERLPERNEVVLVSFKTGMVQLCEYLDDGTSDSWFSITDNCYAWNNVVNAWMPLPEPYKKEGESE